MKRKLFGCIVTGCLLVSINFGQAQSNMGRQLSPFIGQLSPDIEFGASGISQESVSGQNTDLSYVQYGYDLFVPLRQNEQFESAFTSGVQVMDLATRAGLMDAGVALPDHLWDIDFGGHIRKRLDNGMIAGGLFSVGSASDKPFDSFKETNINATGVLQIPTGEHYNQHILFLNYASNREFLSHVPLPGYAYMLNAAEKKYILFGLPFSGFQWALTEQLTAEASYFIPRTVHAKLSYALTDGLTLYSGFDWQSQRWFRAGRDDDDERISFYEKRAGVGLAWAMVKNCTLDLQGGYGFDRFFFEGEDYDDRGKSRISLSDGAFLGAKIRFKF